MRKTLFLSGLFISFLLAFVTACGSSSLVGKWQGVNLDDTTFEFTSKGDLIIKNGNIITLGKYELVGSDIVKVKIDVFGSEWNQAWSYALNGNNLTITGYLIRGNASFVRFQTNGNTLSTQVPSKTQPTATPQPVPSTPAKLTPAQAQKAAEDELKAIQSAVISMMTDNSMANLKVTRDVSNATSDMSVFPGGSAVLYGNKMTGSTVNYFGNKMTKGSYAVNSLGEVMQITTGY